jgi:2-haloacid dehalogenase
VDSGGLCSVARRYRVGVLPTSTTTPMPAAGEASLVDDAVLTSRGLGTYEPPRAIHQRVRGRVGGALTHVATSARDAPGAVDAGIDVVRLRRPGHHLDPGGSWPRSLVETNTSSRGRPESARACPTPRSFS